MGWVESRENCYYYMNPVTSEGKEIDSAIALFQPGSSITFRLDKKYSNLHFEAAFLDNGFSMSSQLRVDKTETIGHESVTRTGVPSWMSPNSSKSFDIDVYDCELVTITAERDSFHEMAPPMIVLIYNSRLS